jgi:DNA repair exonuclease SbcCD ATPase subunit
MRFTDLHIRNFKSFEQTDISFSPGLNVVKGPNEAGKSSIQAAILVALFGDTRSGSQELDQYIRWGQETRPLIRLEFEDESIGYTLEKNFDAGTASLTWAATGDGVSGSATDADEVQRMLGTLLGSQSLDTYLNTACIRSEEVSKLPLASAPVSQRLQAKVVSGRQAPAGEVLESIERELSSLAAGGLRKTSEASPLRLAREHVESLQRSTRLLGEKLLSYQANMQTLTELRHEVITLSGDVKEWTRRLEVSDEAQTLEEDVALLEEHAEDLKGIEVLREGVGHAADELSSLDYDTVSRTLERAHGLERSLSQQRQREGEINHQLAVLVLSQMQNGPAIAPSLLLIGGLAVAAGFAIAAVVTHITLLFAGVIVGLVLIALAFRERRDVPLDASGPFAIELAACVQRIDKLQLELQQVLATYGLHSVEELSTAARAMHPASDARAIRRQRIERLLGEQRTLDRQAAAALVREEITSRKQALTELAANRLSVSAYEHADTTLQTLSARREALQRELYRLEGELGASAVNSEMLAGLEEELASEQVRLARLERRRNGLERARNGVRDAVTATLTQVTAAFRTGVSKHLSPMTNGRYNQVDAQIENGELHLMVYTTDRRRAVRADSLSRATQDQIYLAARMSLLDLICDARQPPLLLDDPFINYDGARMTSTVTLLRDMYSEYQIVLFTCVDRYDAFAANVVTLAGPAVAAESTAAAS